MPPTWTAFVERQWKKYGVFEPSHYSPDGPALRAFAAFAGRARAAGSQVVLVLVPESTVVRARMPPEAMNAIRTGLERLGPDAPPLLDLRDTMPDDAFMDNLHMSEKARPAFTSILSDRLRQLESRSTGR
jgi:hypothetical protein